MTRRTALAAWLILCLALPARADNPAALADALVSAGAGDWAVAMGHARLSGQLATDIVEWQRLRAGQGVFPDYTAFLARHPDWPGLSFLRRKGEATIRPGESADAVVGYFAAEPPQTGTGSLAYLAARARRGEFAPAEAEAVRAWRSLSLTPAEQAAFLDRYPDLLAAHHGGRIAAMLDAGKLDDARRMLPLVTPGTRAVAAARIGLQADDKGVDTLIAAVPAQMAGSGGLAYDRFRWRIRKNRYDEAADFMLERSGSAESLGNPAQWADWRRTLARREMRQGDARKAYRMAAEHHLASGSDYADLEWLSGYIALRKLNDPARALTHFRHFRVAVSGPISLGRAGYWEGRALDALGRREDARAAYAFGAEFQTSFYGLLAAEKAGLPLDPALTGRETYPDWQGAGFTRSSVWQAAQLLFAAGSTDLGERFVLHLAESLGPEDHARLAGFALGRNDSHLALLLAKSAAEQGAVLPRAYFPTHGLETMDAPVPRELALAIARRESEFDPAVVSQAGARGLMQLMPATAQRMAGEVGLPFDAGRLTTDWRYNATLGSAYLAVLRKEFGTSPVLVAAGYNAGPGRPRSWMAERGDPRDPAVDVVDWIEAIPFRETQNYVMRVAESLPIYRARLTGSTGPLHFTDELRGR